MFRELKAKVDIDFCKLATRHIRRTMANKAGARYLDTSVPVQKKTLRGPFSLLLATVTALVAIVGTLVMGTLVAYSALNANDKPVATNASAFMNLCGVIGQNMDDRSNWKANWDVALPDAGNRRFTLSEVAQNATWWSHFSGTAPERVDWASGAWDEEVDRVNEGRSAGAKLPKASEINKPELENYRSFGHCIFNAIPGTLGSFGLNFAGFVTKISSFVATMAFNAEFICSVEPTPGQICIDLLAILGGRTNDAGQGGTGEGGSSGIIGSLTTGLYKPLMIIVVLITALTVAWTGIVKRRFREAFFQAIWLAASVIVGLALLLNPSMLVKAPMIAGNTVVGCIVGAFNGTGCTGETTQSGSGATSTAAKENVCVSDASSLTAAQKATLYVNSMGCSIWSAFVLEPYAQGAFGVSLSELDLDSVIDASSGQTVRQLLESDGWNPSGVDPTTAICVNLQTNHSYNSMGNTFQGRGDTSSGTAGAICNLAVWDLFMKTSAVGGGVTSANNNPDNQWLTVMSRLPANESLFKAYVNDGNSWGKFGMGSLAAIASLLGSFLIIAVSILALVYYVIAIVMMAFAPVFFLFGMHPGRGKRLMLGWLEQVVSNILKYVISAVFLLIAITFYGAILGTSVELFGSLIFVTLITMALWMYRAELIGMLGRVEMGGEKTADMTDHFMNRARGFGDLVGRPSKAVAAGTIAGAVTGAGAWNGFKAAASRELRQGDSLAARTFQAADAISTDNENDLYKTELKKRGEAESAKQTAGKLERAAAAEAGRLEPLAEDVQKADEAVKNAEGGVKQVEQIYQDKQELDAQVALHFPNSDYAARRADREVERVDSSGQVVKETSSEAFARIQNTRQELKQREDELKAAYSSGDHEAIAIGQKVTRELAVELKTQTADFQQNHRAGGAASAYADLRSTENAAAHIKYEYEKAVQSGDQQKAAEAKSLLMNINQTVEQQRSTFTSVYGKDELNRASAAYDKTSSEYIKHNVLDEDEKARLERANGLSYDRIQGEAIRRMDVLQTLENKKAEAEKTYDEARAKVSARIDEASKARTDASFLAAQADHISQARQDITPGEFVSANDIQKILTEAEAKAGVRAGRNAEFSIELNEALNNLNERERQRAEAGIMGEKATFVPAPTEKGALLREAEARHSKLVAKDEKAEIVERINERTEAIKAAEKALAEAQRQAEEAARVDRLESTGRSSLIPKRSDAEVNARREAARNATQAYETAAEKRDKVLNDYSQAETAMRSILESGVASDSPVLQNAERKLQDLKDQLSQAEREFHTSQSAQREALKKFEEVRTTISSEAAQKNLEEAERRAREVRATFENTSAPRVNPKVMEDLPRPLQNQLTDIEKRMNNLMQNADSLDARERAALAEVERQITTLGANPSEKTIKRISDLLPKDKPKRGGLGQALRARSQNLTSPNGRGPNDIPPPNTPSR